MSEPAERYRRRLAETPEVAQRVADFDLRLVDLDRVVALQKVVSLDSAAERVGLAGHDGWPALGQLCLPDSSDHEDIRGTYDNDGRGLTITSLDPNLRVTPVQEIARIPGGGRTIGFGVIFGPSHVHVVEHRSRCFLKDGHHRAAGLLARGVTRIPCVVETARTFADVHAGDPSFVSAGHLLGPHPPLLRDYTDPAVSVGVHRRGLRKVVRIRAEEFVIHD